jgi:enoyl-CoA hydratase
MMSSDFVQTTVEAGIAVVRLSRPPANALVLEMVRDLGAALEDALAGDASALVLAGLPGCFSAGVDLKVVPTYGPAEQAGMVDAINGVVTAAYGCRRPLVAAVGGHAIGGGLCLALCCDYRVAAAGDARLGLTEARAGVPFPAAAMTLVRSELSPSDARYLSLCARNLGVVEARARGIVDEVVPAETVETRAIEVARGLAEMPADAYARTKRSLRAVALAVMDDVAGGGPDPARDSWLSEDTSAAASRLLRGERDD